MLVLWTRRPRRYACMQSSPVCTQLRSAQIGSESFAEMAAPSRRPDSTITGNNNRLDYHA